MKINRLSLFASLGAAIIFLVPGSSLAATEPQTTCPLTKEIGELKALQDRFDGGDSELLRELNLRKGILQKTITCLTTELNGTKTQLGKIPTRSEETKTFAELLNRRLDESVSFYAYEKTQISNLGLKGAKDTAKKFLERRVSYDIPLQNLSQGFLNWMQNQALFEVGAKRLIEINKTIVAFSLPQDHEISKLLGEANQSYKEAKVINQKAWQSLKDNDAEASLEYTKQSLELLAETYGIFLELSEVSKKTLPL